jgi:hypothetical protein
LNLIFSPAERLLATAYISPTGKFRSARMDNMDSPTAPVAPTTATLNFLLISLKKFPTLLLFIYTRYGQPVSTSLQEE